MSLPAETQRRVRERADFACEYCGVREVDAGSILTIDHILPRSEHGSDTEDNLAYACPRCNEYKGAYFPQSPTDPLLWNPRIQARELHMLALLDGTLLPLTDTGRWTIMRLRLNRAALIAYRQNRQRQIESERQLQQYRDTVDLLNQLLTQEEKQRRDQQDLLRTLRDLLRAFDASMSDE